MIPIAILVLISFPPLFGHEIVALLCGVVYGLWIGFAIVAAGTFIGESKRPFESFFFFLFFLRVTDSRADLQCSRDLVRIQVYVAKKGAKAGEDEPQLRCVGTVNARWRFLGMFHVLPDSTRRWKTDPVDRLSSSFDSPSSRRISRRRCSRPAMSSSGTLQCRRF